MNNTRMYLGRPPASIESELRMEQEERLRESRMEALRKRNARDYKYYCSICLIMYNEKVHNSQVVLKIILCLIFKIRDTAIGEKQVNGSTQSFVNKVTNYNSHEPFGNPDYAKEGNDGAKTSCLYDEFFRNAGTSSAGKQDDGAEAIAQSLIEYGHKNRIESITDDAGIKFGFSYNHFGDITEFSQNIDGEKHTILQKNYEYNLGQGNSRITEKVFSDNNTVSSTTTATFDSHGRMQNTTVNGNKSAAYEYQDVASSPSSAQVERIVDSEANEINNYRYDEENFPCGYSIVDKSSAKRKLNVTQTASSRTRYEVDGGKKAGDIFETAIEFDQDNLQSPRVKVTRYYTGSLSPLLKKDDELESYNVYYKYDKLGRSETKSSYYSSIELVRDSIPDIPFIGGIIDGILGILDLGTRINSIAKFDYKTGTALVERQTYTLGLDSYEAGTVLRVLSTSSIDYAYDERNNITDITEIGESEDVFRQEFSYDSFDRVTREVLKLNNTTAKDLKYVYNNKNQVKEIRDNRNNNGIVKSFAYDSCGRLIADHNGQARSYDNYGNVKNIGTDNLVWERRNLLKSYRNASYTYNHQDARIGKSINGITTEYFLDGNKILGENRSDGKKLRYVYDANGLCGVRYSAGGDLYTDYLYRKDAIGNIVGITRFGFPVCKYRYDAWGNVTILDRDGTAGNFAANDIAVVNPFRWKSRYLDNETNWYYIDGRYYDPGICSYITVDKLENLLDNIGIRHAYCRYLVTLNNAVALIAMAAK